MEPVTIGNTNTSITFVAAHRDASGYAELLDVTVSGADLQAGLAVYAGYEAGFDHLVRYFEDLEHSFSGWEGERIFESIEGDLRLTARHNGRVHVRVQLWQHVTRDSWSVDTSIVLEAGEELTRAVGDLGALVRPRPSS